MAKPTQLQKAASEMSKKRWAALGKRARSQFMKRIRAGGGGPAAPQASGPGTAAGAQEMTR
jgi:hypothetical protein